MKDITKKEIKKAEQLRIPTLNGILLPQDAMSKPGMAPNLIFIMNCTNAYVDEAEMPNIDLTLQSYVKMDILPKKIRKRVRKFLKEKKNEE